jgi:hypothetical protein
MSASGPPPSSSPAVAPVAVALQSPAASAALTPLEQARHMHRAAQHAKRQATAAQQVAHIAASQRQATSQAAPSQQQQQLQERQHQQQAQGAASQAQQLTHQPLLSVRDVVVQPPRSLAVGHAGWASPQPQPQPIGSSAFSTSRDLDSSTLQPAEWLALGGSLASGNGGIGSGAPNRWASRNSSETSLGADRARHTANAVHSAEDGSGSSSSPWGNGPVSPASGGQQQAITGLPRRTAVPLRPLPLEGGPVAAADPGAEADLVCARSAVQCGHVSASEAAWNLLSARTSLRTA